MTSRRMETTLAITPRRAQEMFGKMLQNWASDVLSLQRRGMDRPNHREGLWAANSAAEPLPFAQAAERRAKAA